MRTIGAKHQGAADVAVATQCFREPEQAGRTTEMRVDESRILPLPILDPANPHPHKLVLPACSPVTPFVLDSSARSTSSQCRTSPGNPSSTLIDVNGLLIRIGLEIAVINPDRSPIG